MTGAADRRLNPADLVSLLLATVIVVGTLLAPLAKNAGLLPETTVCLSQRIAGVACAGCGMTRSVIALGRGEIAGSLHLNWVAPAVLLIAIAHLLARGLKGLGLAGDLRSFDLATLVAISAILIARSIQIWT